MDTFYCATCDMIGFDSCRAFGENIGVTVVRVENAADASEWREANVPDNVVMSAAADLATEIMANGATTTRTTFVPVIRH